MLRGRKARRGFSLIEIIISLAVLSLASAVIVSVFAAAGQVSRKATDTDNAAQAAVLEIEKFRSGQNPYDYISEFTGGPLEGGGSNSFKKHFDDKWRQVSEPSLDGFTLISSLERIGEAAEADGVVSVMYGISVVVEYEGKGEKLLDMQTDKLFVYRP
ncbi:MAG: type II secretion system protein [Christensenellales bacterium]|jgi:prepilin-type N-terminal cleavage/methylation domain-containing protein